MRSDPRPFSRLFQQRFTHSMRRPLLLLGKAAVSVFLLYISMRAVNFAALSERLSRLNGEWIAATLALQAVQVALQSLRWQMIVTHCGVSLTPRAALRINFIAQFFNQVLPSTVGGDAARIWRLARKGGGWANATYSVLLDRIVGVFVLALIVIGCLPWTLALLRDDIARAALLLIGGGAIAGALVFMTIGVLRWPILLRWAPLRHLREVSRVAWRLCRARGAATAVFALSFAIHLLTIAAVWCMVQSVAASASFALLLFLIPPVILVATVPISIAGWGVREGSMIAAFSYAGLAQSDGLVVSVLMGLTGFIIGAAGGIVWIASDARLPKEPVKAADQTGPASR
jgi:uncharacterized membrane protein YbhN (UPF0104 family)